MMSNLTLLWFKESLQAFRLGKSKKTWPNIDDLKKAAWLKKACKTCYFLEKSWNYWI